MHVRCPHCRNPIEFVEDAGLEEITCPSCGSSFSLLSDTETITHRSQLAESLGHFELVDHLGTGAFGSVWKAIDSELDRTVAVKIPRKGQLDAEEIEKFLRDALCVAFSPDGKRIVSGSLDGTIKVWDGSRSATLNDK